MGTRIGSAISQHDIGSIDSSLCSATCAFQGATTNSTDSPQNRRISFVPCLGPGGAPRPRLVDWKRGHVSGSGEEDHLYGLPMSSATMSQVES